MQQTAAFCQNITDKKWQRGKLTSICNVFASLKKHFLIVSVAKKDIFFTSIDKFTDFAYKTD